MLMNQGYIHSIHSFCFNLFTLHVSIKVYYLWLIKTQKTKSNYLYIRIYSVTSRPPTRSKKKNALFLIITLTFSYRFKRVNHFKNEILDWKKNIQFASYSAKQNKFHTNIHPLLIFFCFNWSPAPHTLQWSLEVSVVEGPLSARCEVEHVVVGWWGHAVITTTVQAAAVSASKHLKLSQGHVIRRRGRAAQLPVAHQHRHRHPSGRRWKPDQLQRLVLLLPLTFVPPVLKPDFDLRGCEFEGVRQVFSLRAGQVALLSEAPLQFRNLRLGEKDPRLPAQSGSSFCICGAVRWTCKTRHIWESETKVSHNWTFD